MYLLVVAAVIIDSSPLKYFWVTVRGCLVLSSGRILPPSQLSSPLSLSVCLATLTSF